jgi:hypothetical protein
MERKDKMTTYVEVTDALVSAGYLSDEDVDAAVVVLTDALVVDEAEAAEGAATADYAEQEDMVAVAEVWEAEDAAEGDKAGVALDGDIIAEAVQQELDDEDAVIDAEVVIAAAYTDAAAALLAAELIDEANLEAAAALISDTWVVEEA